MYNRITALTIFVALLGFSSLANALPASPIKPVVLLLIDTSGSMEYDAENVQMEYSDLDDQLVPTCDPLQGYGKSRFVVAQEVLTGSFVGYHCLKQDRNNYLVPPCPREDCPYPVPHIRVPFTVLQASDGLIDLSRTDVKFGVMTSDTVASDANDATGGYSYGPEVGTNYGARNENAPTGPFVKPSPSDDPLQIAIRNDQVQTSIRSAIPVGGSPISPMLYDALHYFENDPDLAADIYRDCRPKTVILITDGRANLGEATGPYKDSVTAAQELRDAGVDVYVIGFKLADGVDTLVEAIATNNGAISAPLFKADNSMDLAQAFNQILGSMAVATQSRTMTVVSEETGNLKDVQYQFNAAHTHVTTPDGLMTIPNVRQGLLEQSVYQCGLDTTKPNEPRLARILRLSDMLNERADSSRNIYTWIDGFLTPFAVDNASVSAEHLGVTSGQTNFPDFSLDESTGLCKTGFLTGTVAEKRERFRQNLIKFVRAADDTCRRNHKTGAIHHSGPVLQGKFQDAGVSIPSFAAFKNSIKNRPVMLYTATHDGQLHAFRVDRESGTQMPSYWGREEWSYVPNHLLASLKKLPAGASTVMDGSPVLANVVFNRTYATALGTESGNAWHSVLVVGDRDGGRGYTALDVTDPTDGNWEVLWEISHKGRCAKGHGECNVGGHGAFENDFSRLGYTYSKPAIGTVSVCPSRSMSSCNQNQLQEVAVAVFGAGSGDGLGIGAGRSVYVVRMDTGEKLAEFRTGGYLGNVDATCTAEGTLITADMVGDVACYSTFPGTFMTRCFMGDSAGRLWRLEIGSPGIANWNLTLFYDPYMSKIPRPPVTSPIRAPAYSAPALSIKPYRNELVIIYGNGDVDDLNNTTRKNFIVSLTERVAPFPSVIETDRTCAPWNDLTCFKYYPVQKKQVGPIVNFKHFFGYDSQLELVGGALEGERMMGPPVIYGGTAYFTTFVPDPTRPCEPGLGKIWGVDFAQAGGSCDQFKPALPDEVNPQTLLTHRVIGSGTEGAIPYGPVIANRPMCFGDQSVAEAALGGTFAGQPLLSGGHMSTPQLIVQTGVATTGTPEMPAQGPTQRFIPQTSTAIAPGFETLFVSSWGLLFD